jgi:tetratricopeptide (TPR) repeat protein
MMATMTRYLEALQAGLSGVGIRPDQCEFDEARGILVIHPDESEGSSTATRVVPAAALAERFAACPDEAARGALIQAATDAFGRGLADAPPEYENCGLRLLPQLWPVSKIVARQTMLPSGIELPHCGIHGEAPPLVKSGGPAASLPELGVVLVCEHKVDDTSKMSSGSNNNVSQPLLTVETPVLSSDLVRWGVSFNDALRRALENLRSRTKGGPPADKRWEHHPSGCGQSCWQDGFDAARVVLLPTLAAKRKRPDGIEDTGGHVVSFATPSCVLASTSKNPLGLCFLGDTLHLKIAAPQNGASSQVLTTTAYRLLKVRENSDVVRGAAIPTNHPLMQPTAGFIWRWLPYVPNGPPLRASGEFSVPVDAGEVDAILNAAEAGRPVPVFTHAKGGAAPAGTSSSSSGKEAFLAKKEEANKLFKAGEYIKAIQAYDAALGLQPPSPADAAVVHANAAQALLNLAAADEARKVPCAAEALRRASTAAELDPTYAKAHARCAAACEILGETAAAAEFKAKAAGCSAADAATKAARQAEAEKEREAQAARKAAVEKANSEKAAREALLEREKKMEREKAKAAGDELDAKTAAPGGVGRTALFGLDSGLGASAEASAAARLLAGGAPGPAGPAGLSGNALGSPLCSR